MLSGFFNYDNPVWRFIGKFGDLILLNLLWLVCSIPIVTIGASTTAVYYVTLKLARDDDGYTIRSFFKSFKDNFKQATIIWLIMLGAGLILAFDLYFFLVIQTAASTVRTVMLSVFGAIALFYVIILIYVFPLQSRFVNPVKRTLFNAFFMAIRHLPFTIIMVAMDAAVIFMGLMIPHVMMLFMLFGFPMLAFMNSYVLTHIFKKYMPKEKEESEEMRPLFADDDTASLGKTEDETDKK